MDHFGWLERFLRVERPWEKLAQRQVEQKTTQILLEEFLQARPRYLEPARGLILSAASEGENKRQKRKCARVFEPYIYL